MLPNIHEKAWLYHRGKWSMIKNPLFDTQVTYADPHRQSWLCWLLRSSVLKIGSKMTLMVDT